MTDKEALLEALEALHYCEALNRDVDERKMQAITVLRELWAQPEQEPVAHCKVRPLRGDESFRKVEIDWVNQPVPGPLYTAPPQRTEPLPQKKVWTFWDLSGGDITDAIKAKLKEKNT